MTPFFEQGLRCTKPEPLQNHEPQTLNPIPKLSQIRPKIHGGQSLQQGGDAHLSAQTKSGWRGVDGGEGVFIVS